MKPFAVFLMLCATHVSAAQFDCSGTLVLHEGSEDGMRPSFQFSLTLDGSERFAGQGTHIEGEAVHTFDWSGHWIHTQGQIAMIGGLRDQGTEWRAWSQPKEAGVLLMLLKRASGEADLIRCLPREAA